MVCFYHRQCKMKTCFILYIRFIIYRIYHIWYIISRPLFLVIKSSWSLLGTSSKYESSCTIPDDSSNIRETYVILTKYKACICFSSWIVLGTFPVSELNIIFPGQADDRLFSKFCPEIVRYSFKMSLRVR